MNDDARAGKGSGLATFFAVTFTTTWGCWLVVIVLGEPPTTFPAVIPFLLGGFGPVFGAMAVRIRRRRLGEPVPVHTVRFRLNVRLLWALPLLVPAVATVAGGAVLAQALGGPVLSLDAGRALIATAGGAVPFFVGMLVGGPLAEEPGWRGTAYPRLLASMGRFGAALVLGVAWAFWHLPLFFMTGTVQAGFGLVSWSGLLFTLSVFPMAMLTGCAYELGGVPAAVAVHFGVNATAAVLNAFSPMTQAVVLVVQLLVAVAAIALRRNASVTVVDGPGVRLRHG
ncbi:CAAX protease self-immunity [Lentzea waywayandensis]|uniref:CAAX protease self-immunity n=1 Tax=Lentzea waywayandensis TaxID=84724 RepID=A0A1I6FDC5_9PSEU|nr:CPBP family intramembrane glutamic endopeptidase [Lentzea waywayandensis]SFR27986.1 CAAX protease self-immunity [Lentzea waywayandensis]